MASVDDMARYLEMEVGPAASPATRNGERKPDATGTEKKQ